jgi:hypothetical protein
MIKMEDFTLYIKPQFKKKKKKNTQIILVFISLLM